MSTSNTSIRDGRRFRIILFAVLAVVLLSGAAYLWGNRLNADILPANSQRLSETSASRYGNSLGISAVRAVEASTAYRSGLRGVPAVRRVDQAANTSSSLRVGSGTQVLSNLELRRAKAQTQGLSNLELQRARSQLSKLSK
jgi:hypothetical protein